MAESIIREVKFDQFRASYVNTPGISYEAMDHYHAHDTFELFYLCNGERLYYINGENYYVKRGEIILVNRNDVHKTITTQVPDYERILLQIPLSFLTDLKLQDIDLTDCFTYRIPAVILPKKEQNIVEALLYTILDEGTEKSLGYKSAIQAAIAQLLINIHRYAISANHKIDHDTHIHKKINDVVHYIGKNYMHDITIPQLAAEFHISNSHLSRTFRKVTGLTIIEYLNTVRINKAQKLLRNTEMLVTEISAQTGFGSVTHFERVFKKAGGHTPSQFRKFHRQ